METSLSISLTIVVVALAAALVWAARVISYKIDHISKPADTVPIPPFDDSDLWKAIQRLESAVAEGIDHVDKKSKRIDGVIAGAKRRFEASGFNDPGLDAEAGVLPSNDAPGGDPEGLFAMPETVESAPSALQGVPGTLPEGWGVN